MEERIEIPIKVSFSEKENFRVCLSSKDETFNAKFGTTNVVETGNYEFLINKPKIEGNVLIGDKTFKQLGLDEITADVIDNMMIDDLIEGRS